MTWNKCGKWWSNIHSRNQTLINKNPFTENNAEEGGAVYVPEEAEVNTTGDEFNGNNATVGGVFYNIGTINSTGSTYSNSNSTDKGSVVYNAPQATFVSENDQFKFNDGVKGLSYTMMEKQQLPNQYFIQTRQHPVIYNDNELDI